MCCGMMQRFRLGPEHSIERAMMGGVRRKLRSICCGCWRHEESRMQDEPTPTELIKAVADFLRNDITPAISGIARSSCGWRSTRSTW